MFHLSGIDSTMKVGVSCPHTPSGGQLKIQIVAFFLQLLTPGWTRGSNYGEKE